MDKKRDKDEDTTKYGEFIPSYFSWLTLEEQKEIANRLSKITKKWDYISLFFFNLEPLSRQ